MVENNSATSSIFAVRRGLLRSIGIIVNKRTDHLSGSIRSVRSVGLPREQA